MRLRHAAAAPHPAWSRVARLTVADAATAVALRPHLLAVEESAALGSWLCSCLKQLKPCEALRSKLVRRLTKDHTLRSYLTFRLVHHPRNIPATYEQAKSPSWCQQGIRAKILACATTGPQESPTNEEWPTQHRQGQCSVQVQPVTYTAGPRIWNGA